MNAYPGANSILIMDNHSIHEPRVLQTSRPPRRTPRFSSLPIRLTSTNWAVVRAVEGLDEKEP